MNTPVEPLDTSGEPPEASGEPPARDILVGMIDPEAVAACSDRYTDDWGITNIVAIERVHVVVQAFPALGPHRRDALGGVRSTSTPALILSG